MAYGLDPARAFHDWRRLNRDRRLALVEKALKPASNDNPVDGLPLAL